jgi:hypothetical protein
MPRTNADGIAFTDPREAADAAAWSAWAADLTRRFDKLEARFAAWFGAGETDEESVGIVEFTTETLGAEKSERAAAIAKVADVLPERLEAEIAVLSETFSDKLDSKIFGLASLKKFKAGVEEKVSEHEAGLREALAAKFEALAERIDATDKRRRYDRNSARTEIGDLASKLLALSEARASQIDKRLDQVIVELRTLRALLVDGEMLDARDWPIVASLPAPSAQ